MKYVTLIILIIISLVCFSCFSEEKVGNTLPTENELLNRHLDAIGGEAAVAKIQSRIIKGSWIDDRPKTGQKIVVPFTVWANRDGQWLFKSSLESYGFDDSGGWRLDSSGVIVDSYQERSKLGFVFDPVGILNLDRYFLDRKTFKASSLSTSTIF